MLHINNVGVFAKIIFEKRINLRLKLEFNHYIFHLDAM